MGASIMEKGLDSYIRAQFDLEEVDLRTYSPLTLAYIGDGIYDLIIRSLVVGKGNTRANELHKKTSGIVKAQTQARMIELLEDEMPNRQLLQKMHLLEITEKPPVLKL